jgi:subtilisin family serine protease
MTTAWHETTGPASTVIAVLDSGIDFSHPDLANGRWVNKDEVAGDNLDDDGDGYTDDLYGWNWVYGTNDVGDEQRHSTSVASVIAAEGDNGVGVTGVMGHASLMSLKVLDSTGTGDTASAVEALDKDINYPKAVGSLQQVRRRGAPEQFQMVTRNLEIILSERSQYSVLFFSSL